MTSPPVILVTPQELSQSLNPSSSMSAYWVNLSLRRVKHTGNHALLGLMWSAILVQASHAQVTSNDVSRLNPTEVRGVIQVTSEQQVRVALAFVAAHHLKVSITGKEA